MTRIVVIAVLVVCARAFAQTPPPPPPPQPVPVQQDDTEAARRHFEQGVALYTDGNYNAALAEFEQAYRLRPQPFVLYNIGLSQKALFRYTDAIKSLQRFIDESQALAPERKAEAEQIIGELKALLADVTFDVTPPGATLTLDGRNMGIAPFPMPIAMAAGSHKIEITADGFEPQKRDLTITAGVPLRIALALKEIPKTGKVRINSAVPGAVVSIDGQPRGPAPIEVELDAGGHRLEVTADGYQTRRDELVIAAGQARQVEVTLDRIVKPRKPWYKNWYVWGGAAAILVGGVTACTVAGCFDRTQGPLEGTLAPGAGGVQ